MQGGGFCGTRTKTVSLNFANTDGIHLRVRGDGSIFKMNIKTVRLEDFSQNFYSEGIEDSCFDVYLANAQLLQGSLSSMARGTSLLCGLQTDQLDTPESTYQTTFDTVAGQWSDVYMPWHSFMPVTRAQWDPTGKRAYAYMRVHVQDCHGGTHRNTPHTHGTHIMANTQFYNT